MQDPRIVGSNHQLVPAYILREREKIRGIRAYAPVTAPPDLSSYVSVPNPLPLYSPAIRVGDSGVIIKKMLPALILYSSFR